MTEWTEAEAARLRARLDATERPGIGKLLARTTRRRTRRVVLEGAAPARPPVTRRTSRRDRAAGSDRPVTLVAAASLDRCGRCGTPHRAGFDCLGSGPITRRELLKAFGP